MGSQIFPAKLLSYMKIYGKYMEKNIKRLHIDKMSQYGLIFIFEFC